VIEEVIRLKALMPRNGCRTIADTFNRMHRVRHSMSVGKTFVSTTVRKHRLEIDSRRREWKRRVPRPTEANRIWGVDLTAKTDLQGVAHPILGILDHGSRFVVTLQALPDKASITLLRALLDAIELHGKPRAIRTDNEAVFTSRLFRFGLGILGIRHQLSELHCPWQNGRVERFFGALKEKLNRWAVGSFEELQVALGDFGDWYNHVRPHQHLQARIPAEAWLRIDPWREAPRRITYFSAWDGMLTGFHLRR
jgi:transposase InsO family protein